MPRQCRTCFEHHETSISSVTGARTEALKRFVALQREGYAPAMCESACGRHTVCHNDAYRPLAAVRGAEDHLDLSAL